jgi:hypothetical protein
MKVNLVALILMALAMMQLLGGNKSIKRQIASSNAGIAKRGAFSMAMKDSLGFFDDVPDSAWLERLDIARHRATTANPDDPLFQRNIAKAWYQMNWEPNLNCLLEDILGNLGDGHKWTCNPGRIERQSQERIKQGEPPCLVYSIGSRGEFDFERDVQQRMPSCEIHTFDFTDFSSEIPPDLNISFHAWGLKPSYQTHNLTGGFFLQKIWERTPPKGVFKTIQETLIKLGHVNRPIDLFKIDCEGCEWFSYKDWIDPNSVDIRQIQVEVHEAPPNVNEFFQNIHDANFAMFHKEPNIQFADGNCVEFSFLKMARSFFHDDDDVKEEATVTPSNETAHSNKTLH